MPAVFTSSTAHPQRLSWAATLGVATIALLFVIVLFLTSWVADDAAITFRCVLNFLSGWGPSFNIDERVQGFTHPLWFLLLSGTTLLTRNVFVSAYSLSFVCTLSMAWIYAFKLARNLWYAIFGALLLLTSRAFDDFSVSGMENPLSHLLLALYFWHAIAPQGRAPRPHATMTIGALLMAFMYLTRPDLILVCLPMFGNQLIQYWRENGTKIFPLFLGAIPVIAWTGFSLIYYGAPFPNTAYAKLGTGLGALQLLLQGLRYYRNSAEVDPPTLFAIVAALLLAPRVPQGKATAAGIVLYLAYVVMIGGDFMSGRFFTVPLVAAAFILVRVPADRAVGIACLLAQVLLMIFATVPRLVPPPLLRPQQAEQDGIADERMYYFPQTALAYPSVSRANIGRGSLRNWRLGRPSGAIICGGLGLRGLKLGPSVHFIDTCGLIDPLLGRLPAVKQEHWRIGHFYRKIPENYVGSIKTGENLLVDPKLHAYYETIRLVTRGPLWSIPRLIAIVQLNAGLIMPPSGV